jgi:PAS domain S-box-containing protein
LSKVKQRLGYVVYAYSLLAIASLGLFGALHIAAHRPVIGWLEISGAAAIALNLAILKLTSNVTRGTNGFLLCILGVLTLMLVTGGTEGTGIFWLFPVGAFFLTGKEKGIAWMAAFFAMVGAVWLLSAAGMIHTAYSSVVVRQLVVAEAVVAAGLYAYERSREQLQAQSLKSQQELHSEQIRADTIVDNIDQGVVATDNHGMVTFMNHAAEKILGWTHKDLMGKKFIDVVLMLDRAGKPVREDERPLIRSLQTGKRHSVTAIYRAKNGRPIPVYVNDVPIMLNGSVRAVIATFSDMSDEQTMLRAKSEFITLASHQLRTPISAVAWMSELLLNGDAGKLGTGQREYIEDIYRSNQRMASLVSEMLLVSSVDLGTWPVLPEPTDIAALANAVVKQQIALYHHNKAHITESYDPALPKVPCDPGVVEVLLRNLISNALKYTPPNGHIHLSIAVSHAEKDKLHQNSKGSVVITVADDGYGIPHAATNKIFTKFFRSENITHKDTDGTGLGLYIVKSLLDYAGGRVTFHSTENKGTTFTVLLPLEGMARHEPHGISGQGTREAVIGGVHV